MSKEPWHFEKRLQQFGTRGYMKQYDRFIEHDDVAVRLDCIAALEHNGRALDINTAGDLALALAMETDDENLQAELFGRAKTNWQQVLNRNTNTLEFVSPDTIHAAINLANLEHYRMLTYNSIADFETSDRIYRENIKIADILVNAIDAAPNSDQKSRFAGQASELSILLLLQRFGAYQLNGGEYLAVSSLITEDHGRARTRSIERDAWDISVYTKASSAVDLSYKLQVKSRETSYTQRAYSSDIQIIYARQDLGRPGITKPLGITHVLKECIGEITTPSEATSRLIDERTDRLLDLLG